METRKLAKSRFWLILLIVAVALTAVLLCWKFLSAPDGHPKPMTAAELERYAPYAALTEDGLRISDHCTLLKTHKIGERTRRTYTSDTLPQYLYQCAALDAISDVTDENGQLVSYYINYHTAGGIESTLTVTPDGALRVAGVYDPSHDTYYEIYSPTEGYKYASFRHGSGRTVYPVER